MRWNRELLKPKPKPNKIETPGLGDIKTKIGFAFFPVRLTSRGQMVWLENYVKVYKFQVYYLKRTTRMGSILSDFDDPFIKSKPVRIKSWRLFRKDYYDENIHNKRKDKI